MGDNLFQLDAFSLFGFFRNNQPQRRCFDSKDLVRCSGVRLSLIAVQCYNSIATAMLRIANTSNAKSSIKCIETFFLQNFEFKSTATPRLCHCAYTMSNLFSKPIQIMQIVRVNLIELAEGGWLL